MATTTIGIKELKDHLSANLDLVKAGGTVTITERGKPVGKIVPIDEPSVDDRLQALVRSGYCTWSGAKLTLPDELVLAEGASLVDALLADREERDRSL